MKKKSSKKAPKLTQVQSSIDVAASLIRTGRMLSIDPSSGSRGSMPGFALFENGQCLEWGILQLDFRKCLKEKLFQLGELLRTKFGSVDVLVIEQIAPYMQAGGTGFKTGGVVNLHKSIGAVFSAIYSQVCVEIPPQSWHSWLRRKGLEESYDKNDANDALVMALFALENAGVELDWSKYMSAAN